MTAAAFKFWRKEIMDWSMEEAAEELGLRRDTVSAYEKGQWRDGKVAPIPRSVALACTALFHKLDPWSREL